MAKSRRIKPDEQRGKRERKHNEHEAAVKHSDTGSLDEVLAMGQPKEAATRTQRSGRSERDVAVERDREPTLKKDSRGKSMKRPRH